MTSISSTFKNEKMYQTTMHLARKMLSDGVISEKEYCRIDTMFTQKYKPVFGTLFSDIRLTNPADRVMYSTEEA